MSKMLDFHVYVFPDPIEKIKGIIPEELNQVLNSPALEELRNQGKAWLKPLAQTFQQARASIRFLPEPVRGPLEEVSSLLPIPGLLVESTIKDLHQTMENTGVNYALLHAFPPFLSNDRILDICDTHPHLYPAISIASGESNPEDKFKNYLDRGAKALKFYPTPSAVKSKSRDLYRALIQAAAQARIPIIIQTNSRTSHVGDYEEWYQDFPEAKFVISRMNSDEPRKAWEFCEKYSNIYLDTAEQPSDVIGEAARHVDIERIVFGSEWPWAGNNMEFGRKAIDEAIQMGLLNQTKAELILGLNAIKLLGIEPAKESQDAN